MQATVSTLYFHYDRRQNIRTTDELHFLFPPVAMISTHFYTLPMIEFDHHSCPCFERHEAMMCIQHHLHRSKVGEIVSVV